MEWKRRRQRFIYRMPLFFCVSTCLFSVCALISTIGTRTVCLDIISPSIRKADCLFQESENSSERKEERSISKVGFTSWSFSRRNLKGVGSSPPRCTSKCGRCTPCKPVHVPVPPGAPVTMEYYPEAWRCKCGNKLYMP